MNMSKEIAIQNQGFTKDQVQLITNTVAKGATQDELKLFLYVSKRVGLDPLAKQVHFVKREGQMTVQTGIDGLRTVAGRTGELAGIDDAEYDTEEEEHPNKATVVVHKMVNGQKVSFTASARWKEYYPGEKMGFMWKKMPYLMLGKCAESLALRKAFPNDLSGVYTDEEMAQADGGAEVKTAKVFKKPVATEKVKKDLFQAGLDKITTETKIETLQDWQMKIAEANVYTDVQKEKLYQATEKRIAELSKVEEGEVAIEDEFVKTENDEKDY